jgi:hypothetical protein
MTWKLLREAYNRRWLVARAPFLAPQPPLPSKSLCCRPTDHLFLPNSRSLLVVLPFVVLHCTLARTTTTAQLRGDKNASDQVFMHKHGASEVKTWHGINSAIQMPMMALGFSRSRPTFCKYNKLLTLECVLYTEWDTWRDGTVQCLLEEPLSLTA